MDDRETGDILNTGCGHSARQHEGVAELFKVCGDATRVSIMCALLRREMCVGELAGVLGMSDSAISHQLRVLRHSRLVSSRREGKSVLYTLADDHIEDIFKTAFAHVQEERGNWKN